MVNWFPGDNLRLLYRIDLNFCTLIHNDTRKKPIVLGGPPGPVGVVSWGLALSFIHYNRNASKASSFLCLVSNKIQKGYSD